MYVCMYVWKTCQSLIQSKNNNVIINPRYCPIYLDHVVPSCIGPVMEQTARLIAWHRWDKNCPFMALSAASDASKVSYERKPNPRGSGAVQKTRVSRQTGRCFHKVAFVTHFMAFPKCNKPIRKTIPYGLPMTQWPQKISSPNLWKTVALPGMLTKLQTLSSRFAGVRVAHHLPGRVRLSACFIARSAHQTRTTKKSRHLGRKNKSCLTNGPYVCLHDCVC